MKSPGRWSSSGSRLTTGVWNVVNNGNATNYRYTPVTTNVTSRYGYNSGPGWRSLAASGNLAPTDAGLSRVRQVVTEPSAAISIYSEKYWEAPKMYGNYYESIKGVGNPNSNLFLDLNNLNGVFGTVSSGYINDARSKLMKSLAGVQVDLLTNLGEMKETTTMIAGLAHRVAGVLLKHDSRVASLVGKTSLKKLSDVRDVITNEWLQFQYGIKPLVNDLEAAAQLYENRNAPEQLRTDVKGATRQNLTRSTKFAFSPTGVPLQNCWTHVTYERYLQFKVGGRILSTAGLQYPGTAAKLGLCASNVLPAMWELIPYSFLVDYFSNVGDVIQGWSTPLPAMKYSWDVNVVEDTATWSNELYGRVLGTKPYRSYQSGVGGNGCIKWFNFTRTANPTTIRPTLSFSSWEDLSQTKKANVVALGSQFIARKAHSLRLLSRFV